MFEGVMIASDCADWWEKQIKDFHKELEEYVTDNPGFFGVVVATGAATTADFAGAFFIDLMRLGEGVASGGLKGVAQDLLRVVQFIPEGKIVKMAEPLIWSLKEAKFARAAVQNFNMWKISGGFCVPLGITQALLRTGQKMGVGVVEIVESLGAKMEIMEAGKGVLWDVVEPALLKLGARFGSISAQGLTKFEQLAEIVERSGEPLLVRVIVGEGTSRFGHALLIAKTSKGIKVIDRIPGGGVGQFRNFEELSGFYRKVPFEIDTAVNFFSFKNMAVSEELLTMVERYGLLGCLVRISVGVFDFNRKQATPEFIKEDFQRFVAQKRGDRAPIRLKEINVAADKTIQVTPRTTLSDIALAEYGDWKLWPVIYDLNKEKIGRNPNRLQTGLKLIVLPLSAYTPKEIIEAKSRSASWQNFR